MDSKLHKLDELIKELIQLGEDRDELGFWQSIFTQLPEAGQIELLSNLEQELDSLKKFS